MKITLPTLKLWDTGAPTIRLINEGEFKIGDRLKLLGLDTSELRPSFGCIDRAEIIERQDLMRFLTENAEFRKLVLDRENQSLAVGDNGESFIENFVAAKPFWSLCEQIDRLVTQSAVIVPTDIRNLNSFLTRMRYTFGPSEENMSAAVMSKLVKATQVGGIMYFDAEYKTGNEFRKDKWEVKVCRYTDFFGYRQFSENPPPKLPDPDRSSSAVPAWIRSPIKSFKRMVAKRRFNSWARPTILAGVPEYLARPVYDFVEDWLNRGAANAGVKWKGLLENKAQLLVTVGFNFGPNGLMVRLLGVEGTQYMDKNHGFTPIRIDGKRYSLRARAEAERLNKKALADSARLRIMSLGLAGLVQELKRVNQDFLEKGVMIPISDSSIVLHWDSIRGLIGSDPEFLRTFEESVRLRQFVYQIFERIRPVAKIAECFVKRSEEWGLPLHYPKILEDNEHLVSFKEMVPIHLMGRLGKNGKPLEAKDLVPVRTIAPLNGNMLGFTGQNSGGKTAAEEEIVFMIHDAQSGFPLFGASDVCLNVKNTVGLVFIERGQGSTVELMLKKMGAVVQGAQDHSRNGTVIILDELGTGTQEAGGLRIGKSVLAKLAETQCSVVFSTQITELAAYAEKELGAKCFAFDLEHGVVPGIDTGHPERLARQLGVDKILGLN